MKINQIECGEGKAKLFYHISIDTPVRGIMLMPESAIATQIEQAKIDALAAGSLVEVSKNIVILASQTQA